MCRTVSMGRVMLWVVAALGIGLPACGQPTNSSPPPTVQCQCKTFEYCASDRTCRLDPVKIWRVQPTAASIGPRDSFGNPWDPGDGPPDAFADTWCPINAEKYGGSTPMGAAPLDRRA